jgi:orotate phosphoribosyltransferase
MSNEELLIVLRREALLEGDFTLRSGKKSKYYFDKYLFETSPVLLREIASRLVKYVDEGIDLVAGAEIGGIPLATIVSLREERRFLIVRNSKKEGYGTGKLIEGRYNVGEAVLLIEDVVTSGGQTCEAIKTLRDAGLIVRSVVAVLDREQGGRQAIEAMDVSFNVLFTLQQLMDMEQPVT